MSRDFILNAEKLGLVFLNTGKLSREHNVVLRELVTFIYNKLSKKINYDHLNMTIPRLPLPLKYRGKRYDIAFVFESRLVLVQIDTFKPTSKSMLEMGKHGKG